MSEIDLEILERDPDALLFYIQIKMAIRRLTIFGTFLVTVALGGCGRTHYQWVGVVDDFGEFHFAKNGNIVRTWHDDEGIVHYTLQDSNRRILLKSDRKLDDIGMYMHWAMCFDDSNSLWVNSSDIGITYWKHMAKDEFERITIRPENDTLLRLMPGVLDRH